MIKNLLLNDFKHNRMVVATLFSFIGLAALLMCCAINIMVYLNSSLTSFFDKADPPHFLQMHTGTIDQERLNSFANETGMVKKQQIVPLLNIDAYHLTINPTGEAEINSVMDNAFMAQNKDFDYLLNLENKRIEVYPGNVAVPIYYKQKYDLMLGDKITISKGEFSMHFRITDFIRDAQMNSSLVSSKRLLINKIDFNTLKEHIGDIEHIIEYQFFDIHDAATFEMLYQSGGLPQNGPAVTYPLLKTLNALSDGVMVVIIIMASLLVICIALICLRYTILSSIEEDIREIGVLKAIGVNKKQINGLYKLKYKALIIPACLSGYFVSLLIIGVFTENLSLYMGITPRNWIHYLMPLLGAYLIYSIAVGFCWVVLRKIAKISPVEAYQVGMNIRGSQHNTMLHLHKNRYLNVHMFLGIKSVVNGVGRYGLLCAIFALCTFLFVVPLNLLNTMQSASFIQYMGVVNSDIRIDLRQGDNMDNRFTHLMETMAHDEAIANYAGYVTARYKVENSQGQIHNLQVESGDYSAYILPYVQGRAPQTQEDIALSILAGKMLGKTVGDSLMLYDGETWHILTVSGFYQDITNGGQTAKTQRTFSPENVLWYVISVDLKEKGSIEEKARQYAKNLQGTRVTGIQNYVAQTLGNTIEQLKQLTVLVVGVVLGIAMLITALVLKMHLAKDAIQIAIQRSLGVSITSIALQYSVQVGLILLMGFIAGIIAATTSGQSLIGLLMSTMGASYIHLLVDPVMTFLLVPLMMVLAVGVVTLASCKTIGKNRNTLIIFE